MANDNRFNRPEENRPKRVPIHEQHRNVMTASQKPGFVRRWVNDVADASGGSRIEKFKLAGYMVVEDEVKVGDTQVKNQNQTLGTGARKVVDSSGKTAVLMEIPKELYEEDQRAKQRQVDAQEADIVRTIKKSRESGAHGELDVKVTK